MEPGLSYSRIELLTMSLYRKIYVHILTFIKYKEGEVQVRKLIKKGMTKEKVTS